MIAQLIRGRNLIGTCEAGARDARDVDVIRAEVARSPDDIRVRATLIGALHRTSVRGALDPARVPHIEWFINHAPDAHIGAYGWVFPRLSDDGPEAYQRCKTAWLARAIDMPSVQNAVFFFSAVEPLVAERLMHDRIDDDGSPSYYTMISSWYEWLEPIQNLDGTLSNTYQWSGQASVAELSELCARALRFHRAQLTCLGDDWKDWALRTRRWARLSGDLAAVTAVRNALRSDRMSTGHRHLFMNEVRNTYLLCASGAHRDAARRVTKIAASISRSTGAPLGLAALIWNHDEEAARVLLSAALSTFPEHREQLMRALADPMLLGGMDEILPTPP